MTSHLRVRHGVGSYCVGIVPANEGSFSNLYSEDNSLGQHTFTWLADQNTTDFTGDIAPLLQGLSGEVDGPTGNDYLGYVAFGSETLHSDRNATFYVPRLELDILVS